jgi:hypothetical protein
VSPIDFLCSWYAGQCDGAWENARGITIESLVTPGWMVTIDLEETALEHRPMIPLRDERSPTDWLVCEVSHHKFIGQGDPRKLPAILAAFQNWAAATPRAS